MQTLLPKPAPADSQSLVSELSESAEVSQGSSISLNIVNVIASPSPVEDTGSLQKFYDLSHYGNQLSSEQKERPLTDMEYMAYVVIHLKDWKCTARVGFGLSEGQVAQLESNNHGSTKECAYQAYLKWRMETCYKAPPTVWQIIEILHTAREFDTISHLLEYTC